MHKLTDLFSNWKALFALVLSVGLLSACGNSGNESQKKADLVYVNWAEGIAYTHLAQNVLEDKMGYEVTITSAGVGPAYTSVASGDKDAFMETWLPVLHRNYYKKFKSDIVDLGKVYEGTQSGLVVPSYVTINNISELNDNVDKFDGEITGIDAGAGIMQTTDSLINDVYDLNYELVNSSGPAMTSALKSAIEKKEWIVVTGWKPHWMWGRFDLKFLKQDQDKVWKSGNIHIMGRKNLKEEKPELAEFLSNMYLTDSQLADLMLKVNQSDKDVSEVTTTWMENHPDVIESWIPESEMSESHGEM
jgi:glycine betaine/proline transport system substrate-binding protein